MAHLKTTSTFALFCIVMCVAYFIGFNITSERRIAHYTRFFNYNTKASNKAPLISESLNLGFNSFWETLEIDTVTGTQILQYFEWANCSSCRLKHDFGGTIRNNPSGLDGQKSICIDTNIAPQPNKCITYSFGIGKDWSFDEAMVEYGCKVYAFDPFIDTSKHNYHPRINFYDWGLSGQDANNDEYGDLNIRSLSTIYNKLTDDHGHVAIDYLKIDIEQSEWDVLPNIISSGMLSNIRQLGVEFHLYPDENIETYRRKMNILRSLELMGMIRFDSKYNPWNAAKFTQLNISGFLAYEIAWYNNRLLFNTNLKKFGKKFVSVDFFYLGVGLEKLYSLHSGGKLLTRRHYSTT